MEFKAALINILLDKHRTSFKKIDAFFLYFSLSAIVFTIMQYILYDRVRLNSDTAFLWWTVSNDPKILIKSYGGLSTAFYNIHHGLAWLHHLFLIDRLGLGLNGVAIVTNFLFCLSLGIAGFLCEIFFGRLAGLIAYYLCFQSVHWISVHTNASLIWFPSVLIFCSLAAAIYYKRGIFWILLSAAFSLSTQYHFASIIMLPSLMFLFFLFQPKQPAKTLLLSLYVFCLSWILISWDILFKNISWILNKDFADAGCNSIESTFFKQKEIFFSVIFIILAIILLIRNFRGSPGKIAVAGTVILTAGSLITLIASYSFTGFYPNVFFDMRIASFKWALIIVSVGGISVIFRIFLNRIILYAPQAKRYISAISFICCALMSLNIISDSLKWAKSQKNYFSFSDAEAIAQVLPELGIDNFREASLRLRVPEEEAYKLISALSVLMPPGVKPTERYSNKIFLVGRFPDDLCECIENGCIKPGQMTKTDLGLIPVVQNLGWDEFTASWIDTETGTEKKISILPNEIEFFPGHPRIAKFDMLGKQVVRFTVQARLDTNDPLLISQFTQTTKRYDVPDFEFSSFSGFEFSGSLNQNMLVLKGGQRGKIGTIAFDVHRSRWDGEAWMPQIAEIPIKEACAEKLLWVSKNFYSGSSSEEQKTALNGGIPNQAKRCDTLKILNPELYFILERFPVFELFSRMFYLIIMISLLVSSIYVLKAVGRIDLSDKS